MNLVVGFCGSLPDALLPSRPFHATYWRNVPMRSSKLMTRLSLLVAIGWSTAGLADTYVTIGGVRVWRGDRRSRLSVSAPFVWRCLTSETIAPSPHPARRTRRADFPQRALFQCIRPSRANGRRSAPADGSVPAFGAGTGRNIGGTPFPVCHAFSSTRSADVARRSGPPGDRPARPVLG